MMIWLLLVLAVATVAQGNEATIYHGVVAATNHDNITLGTFCLTFDPSWFSSEIYMSKEVAPQFEVFDLSQHVNGCEPIDGNVADKAVVIIDNGSCSIADRTSNLLGEGVKLIIVARIHGNLNLTDVPVSNFSTAPIVLINSASYDSLVQYEETIYISFYYPVPSFDGNVLLIYASCIFCIVAGSYWSLYPKHMKLSEFWTTTPRPPIRLVLTTTDPSQDRESEQGKSSVWSNILFGSVIVGVMASMLLLLYFAYKYFVYVFIALFCSVSSTGIYSLLYPAFAMIDVFHFGKGVMFRSKERNICFPKVALWLACFCITIFWFVKRHEYSIWPLQVFMGICVCLNIIKSVPLPNLKIIAIIMMMLFIYDIFFVFITPYFTKDGVSIMERVATGASSNKPVFDAPQEYSASEQIPLSIKVPYLQKCDIKVCGPIYGMIGFGDVVIPGLLVGYAAYFDTLAHPGETKWYYIVSCTAYAIGLILTYVALIGMKVAQPALLYLVPCTLVAVFGTALKRKEVRAIWTGRAGVAAPRPFFRDDGLPEDE